MRIRFSILAFSCLLLMNTASLAQETKPNSTVNWTGVYGGVLAGYVKGKNRSAQAATGSFPTEISVSGAAMGATIGANYQFGQFVLGAEGDIAWSGATGRADCTGSVASCSATHEWMGTLRARMGVAVDKFLIYGTAGAAVGGVRGDAFPGTIGTTGTDAQTFIGWTAGLGAEYALSENWRTKIAYSYTDFGLRNSPSNSFGTTSFSHQPASHAIKSGLNYAFEVSSYESDAATDRFGPEMNWSGFYAGVLTGYGAGDIAVEGTTLFTRGQKGALVGVTLGGNHQIDQFVLGLEGDVAWSGLHDRFPAKPLAHDMTWVATLRGRVGFVLSDLLFFGTAGIAAGDIRSSFDPAFTGYTDSDTRTHMGWTAGLGAEYAVFENVRLKAEYSYTDLGRMSVPVGVLGPGSLPTSSTFHAVKLGVNYAF